MDVSLVMFKADGTRRDFPVTGDRLVIGRKNTCDLRIPLSSVSRQHCTIHVRDGHIKLQDMGSSNGTFHNDSRVQEATLAAGDEVVVGPVVFTLMVDGEPTHIEPIRTVLHQHADDNVPSPAMPVATPDDSSIHDEVEGHSTTMDMEVDDPIATLQALSEAEQDEHDDLSMLDDDQP